LHLTVASKINPNDKICISSMGTHLAKWKQVTRRMWQ
jgi:hypothetical protein